MNILMLQRGHSGYLGTMQQDCREKTCIRCFYEPGPMPGNHRLEDFLRLYLKGHLTLLNPWGRMPTNYPIDEYREVSENLKRFWCSLRLMRLI